LEKLFANTSESSLGLVINERLLHFPVQIAGPAFASLKEDIKSSKALSKIKTFIMILKIRFNEEAINSTTDSGPSKPKGKAAKKRALANKLADADCVYDNPEEELLFQVVLIANCL
jgi:hypothetical protein